MFKCLIVELVMLLEIIWKQLLCVMGDHLVFNEPCRRVSVVKFCWESTFPVFTIELNVVI